MSFHDVVTPSQGAVTADDIPYLDNIIPIGRNNSMLTRTDFQFSKSFPLFGIYLLIVA